MAPSGSNTVTAYVWRHVKLGAPVLSFGREVRLRLELTERWDWRRARELVTMKLLASHPTQTSLPPSLQVIMVIRCGLIGPSGQ
jgi:hypothetical protein